MHRPKRVIQPVGSARPYTVLEIQRQTCSVAGCSRRAAYQWQCCATGNRWMPLCKECDVALNEMVLNWSGHPEAEPLIKQYRRNAGL